MDRDLLDVPNEISNKESKDQGRGGQTDRAGCRDLPPLSLPDNNELTIFELSSFHIDMTDGLGHVIKEHLMLHENEDKSPFIVQ